MTVTSFKLLELSTEDTQLPPAAPPSLLVTSPSFSAALPSSPAGATVTSLSGLLQSFLARLNEVKSVLSRHQCNATNSG